MNLTEEIDYYRECFDITNLVQGWYLSLIRKNTLMAATSRHAQYFIRFCPSFWAIVSFLWTNTVGNRLTYCCIVLYPYAFLACYLGRRNTSYGIIEELTTDSYWMFGRKLCSVALDRWVYYIPLETYISKTEYKEKEKPFIALSNQPFGYQNPTKAVNFIVRYDLHTIVVLPNDDRTKPLLPV